MPQTLVFPLCLNFLTHLVTIRMSHHLWSPASQIHLLFLCSFSIIIANISYLASCHRWASHWSRWEALLFSIQVSKLLFALFCLPCLGFPLFLGLCCPRFIDCNRESHQRCSSFGLRGSPILSSPTGRPPRVMRAKGQVLIHPRRVLNSYQDASISLHWYPVSNFWAPNP